MLLSGTDREGQPNADLHSIWNPAHALVSNKQVAGKASQMLTYILFKAQNMFLSAATRKKSQLDADSQSVQNPEHALVSNKQERPARWTLTHCSKSRACSCQQQADKASQMLTYLLFIAQSILSSATSRKSQPDSDLQPVQHQACSCQQQGERAS